MIPTSVMPIYTVERNFPGSAASASATLAPLLPSSAATFKRAGRAETIASSDMENKPLSTTRPTMMKASGQGNGVTTQAASRFVRAREGPAAPGPVREPFRRGWRNGMIGL